MDLKGEVLRAKAIEEDSLDPKYTCYASTLLESCQIQRVQVLVSCEGGRQYWRRPSTKDGVTGDRFSNGQIADMA